MPMHMLALRGDLEDRGSRIAFNTPVDEISRANGRWQVHFGGKDAGTIVVEAVVNAAGLARRPSRNGPKAIRRTRATAGAVQKYFSYGGKPVFTRLIYQCR